MCSNFNASLCTRLWYTDQIETIPCHTFTQKGNTTFGVLRNSFNAATPLGCKCVEKDGTETIVLAPSDDFVIDPQTFLLVIALDISSALASSSTTDVLAS